MTNRRRDRRTRTAVTKADEQASELGVLRPVDPAMRRPDGSPQVGGSQVYVMKTGTVFHPAWCQIVADGYDEKPARVLVIMESEAGLRRHCRSCDTPLAP
jgi:hypothetical protein